VIRLVLKMESANGLPLRRPLHAICPQDRASCAGKEKMKKKWKKLPAISQRDLHIGCLNCSTAAMKAPMDMEICVGFGMACVEKDNVLIYDGEEEYRLNKKVKKVRYFENQARKDPDHDWRIIKHGPMHGETFQRHGKNDWPCIESTRGFA